MSSNVVCGTANDHPGPRDAACSYGAMANRMVRPDDGFVRASPSARGIDACSIGLFLDQADTLGVELNSFMLWRAGAVVAEGWWWPYRPDLRHMMHSATKSFLSAAVGLAISEGKFALDDRISSFFPKHAPLFASENRGAITVADLLTQTSGHARGASGSQWRRIPTSWIAEFLKIDVPFQPGTVFRYSSATSFMLSAIITRTTGDNVHSFIKPRLLEPLGIDDLTWDMGPENINPGGNGISARTADLLKLAVLHHQGGIWNGQRVLPADWVGASVTPKRGNPYGYHWWVGPGATYYAYGVFGQFAFVFPEHDAILVTTAAAPYGEETLRSLVWHHFPAMFDRALPASPATGEAALADRLARLRLLPALSSVRSKLERDISDVVFRADDNDDAIEWIKLRFDEDRCVFTAKVAEREHEVIIGLCEWIEGHTTMPGGFLHHGYDPPTLRVVAGGRWSAPNRFDMTWQFNETAFRDTVSITFDGADALTLLRSVNTNSTLPVRPPVVARRSMRD